MFVLLSALALNWQQLFQEQHFSSYRMFSFALDAAVSIECSDFLPRAADATADSQIFVMTLFIRRLLQLPRHHHWLISTDLPLCTMLCVCLPLCLSVNHSPLYPFPLSTLPTTS